MQTVVAQFATSLHSFSSIRPCTVDLLRGSCQRHNRPPTHFADKIEAIDDQASQTVYVEQFGLCCLDFGISKCLQSDMLER